MVLQRLAHAVPAAAAVRIHLVEDADPLAVGDHEVVHQFRGFVAVRRPEIEGQAVVRRRALRFGARKREEEVHLPLAEAGQHRQHARDGGRADVVEQQENPILFDQLDRIQDRLRRIVRIVIGLDPDLEAVDAAGGVDVREVRHRAAVQIEAELGRCSGKRGGHAEQDLALTDDPCRQQPARRHQHTGNRKTQERGLHDGESAYCPVNV